MASAQTVSVDQYNAFVARYDKSEEKKWYRFGQAFYNEMVTDVGPHPELFYCTDRKKAEQIIFETYITF
jgi:hypothetical protein